MARISDPTLMFVMHACMLAFLPSHVQIFISIESYTCNSIMCVLCTHIELPTLAPKSPVLTEIALSHAFLQISLNFLLILKITFIILNLHYSLPVHSLIYLNALLAILAMRRKFLYYRVILIFLNL